MIFIDVHKLLRICIVLKALHTINACLTDKHVSRTCMFNHSSCIPKNRPSLKDLSKELEDHGRHSILSFLSSIPISVLCVLVNEANKLTTCLGKSCSFG